ncbi:helix-turn-helix domain-containing protein [Micromonospora coerulea]|uniref:helix-turn-helix domain-containing protein n=1 Tax=Micromonospora coerulea TaxID=47856 RepID=UPI0019045818|nr:helix-turn-helix transcriptional regulator [Micromonospora veneta]
MRTRGVPGTDERARLRSTLGAALRRERVARRLSQRSLATLAGCDRRTVQRLEAGQLRPTTALVAALAHALAVPPGYAPAGRRELVDALRAELVAAAGPSLVESTPGGARRRRRRLRRARLAATRVAVPLVRAQRGLPPQRQAARVVPADVAQAVRRYAR